MDNEFTPSENRELMQQQRIALKDLIQQQEETTESTNKFKNAMGRVGTDVRDGVNKKVEGIKSDVKSTITKVPDMLTSSLDPLTGTLLKGVTGAVKKIPTAASYAKGLFSDDKDNDKTKSTKKTNQKLSNQTSVINNTNDELAKQTTELTSIRENTFNSQRLIRDLVSVLRGDRLDKLETRREEAKKDDQLLAAINSLEAGGAAVGGLGTGEEEMPSGLFDSLGNFKDKLLEIGATLLGAKLALRAFKGRVTGAAAATGKAAKRTAQAAAQSRPGRAAARTSRTAASRTASGVRSAISGTAGATAGRSTPPRAISSSAAKAAAAGATAGTSTSKMAEAAVKYPRLLKFAKFIRGVPGLSALAAGVEGILVASDDEMPPEEKKKELSRILGGALGGVGGAKIGGVLGSLAFPGLGTVAGALAGGVGGYFLGGWTGKKIASTLLNKPEDAPPLPNTQPSSDLVPRGESGPVKLPNQNSKNMGIEQAQMSSRAASARSRANAPSTVGNDVNVATNVTNNSNTTVQNRPPASSMPDNMSDTMSGNSLGRRATR